MAYDADDTINMITTATIGNDSVFPTNSMNFFIGIFLAFLSSLFIGSSFILKKKGLLNLINYNVSLRAGSGGFGYLCEIQWWVGLLTMGFGELCNFAAYGFAPASVVTPLGALSVLVSALMAVRFLDEKLNLCGKIGCLLTIFGSIIIVIHAPKESEVNSLNDFALKIRAPEFILFSLVTCIIIVCLIIYYGPRIGSKYVFTYILICSLLGAFTVTACKGVGIGLKELYTHKYTYPIWLTFLCIFIIVFCIIVQMIYLNKALDLFPTATVTTVYYVFFTTCVLITSGILFHEWKRLTIIDISACLLGFSIITCGLTLINYLKTTDTQSINGVLYPYFASNSQLSSIDSFDSTRVVSSKEQHYMPIKSYSDLLLDDHDMSLSTSALNEQQQQQSMLLINESDLNC